MKYCEKCGNSACDEAAICVKCGNSFPSAAAEATNSALASIIKVFMVLGCISTGLLIIPLLWSIPLTISVFRSLRKGKPIGSFVKICSLLFVNLIAGICMFFVNDNKN
ncbi:MAG: hypothetical protein IKY44_02890 [Clostridia bacterium]|nr:hypothetical protein [Clostridia bacterium]